MQRDGPGLLLRDILRGEDDQIEAVATVLVTVAPDIVALQGFDYDLNGTALAAFADMLRDKGLDYPYRFAARPNTGIPTGHDMDGNGRRSEPRDAQSYGRFSGQGGMAIMSKYPIIVSDVRDFTDMLWRDLPAALLPQVGGTPFPSAEVQAIQRLSTTGHWVVPIKVTGAGRIDLMTFHASPPEFDGPEDRNGKRNHDEIVFWQLLLDGTLGPKPNDRFVLLGGFNQDPDRGEGIKAAIRGILGDPRLQDVQPLRTGSTTSPQERLDTVDWDDPVPGNLRVDYILPSAGWRVERSGVYWPDGPAGETAAAASRHRLVWVDLTR